MYTFRKAVMLGTLLAAAAHVPLIATAGLVVGGLAILVAVLTFLPFAVLFERGQNTLWAPPGSPLRGGLHHPARRPGAGHADRYRILDGRASSGVLRGGRDANPKELFQRISYLTYNASEKHQQNKDKSAYPIPHARHECEGDCQLASNEHGSHETVRQGKFWREKPALGRAGDQGDRRLDCKDGRRAARHAVHDAHYWLMPAAEPPLDLRQHDEDQTAHYQCRRGTVGDDQVRSAMATPPDRRTT